MNYREMSCLAIHDISGVGKCSLTVALPVLSCCGVETSVLPTAVLSTHTGGFTGFTYRDLTGDILPMARHWKSLGCRFQALYTGFLGSEAQIGLVEEMFDWFGGEDTLIWATAASSTRPTPPRWPTAWPACAAGRTSWCPT